MSVRKADVTIF